MVQQIDKIGLGGGCHWCTEAVFQSLRGVSDVRSGWICATGEHSAESEGVVIQFDPQKISLETLIDIHLLTHASASNHSMRHKYRSAIYMLSEDQLMRGNQIVETLAARHRSSFITQTLLYSAFRPVSEAYRNYYFTAPDRPFCVNIIEPKLQKLITTHRDHVDKTLIKPN